MKSLLKKFIPEFILLERQKYLGIIPDKQFEMMDSKVIFENTYKNKIWGKSSDEDDGFFSGEGTHNQLISSVYVNAVSKFLTSFSTKPNAVDLGCGDFFIGSSIRNFCDKYIACDIVVPLIERNKKKYADLNVDFRVLNLAVDSLPTGDVLFVRQVLQHLSNSQIKGFINSLQGKYKFLIITEHLPLSKEFTPNLDKPSGPNTRIGLGKYGSGIVLTEPPFNLAVNETKVLCQVESEGGLIATLVYTF